MKKFIWCTASLIAIDQGIKMIVYWLYMGIEINLIPNILLFSPVQNKHMNYIGSLFEVKTPLIVMILLVITGFFITVMAYRYCLFISEKRRVMINLYLCFGISGLIGAFIDCVFWGGSIDFIQLINWFTFDLKDVYLSTMATLIILYMILYIPEYYKLSKDDRKKYDLIEWIKIGCPIKPIT